VGGWGAGIGIGTRPVWSSCNQGGWVGGVQGLGLGLGLCGVPATREGGWGAGIGIRMRGLQQQQQQRRWVGCRDCE